MQLATLFTDDDAVSPVIGVILMVAITVILAAVIGAFVLNLGGGQNAAPQASFEFSDDGSGNMIIKHSGGDAIDNSTITLSDSSTTIPSSDLDTSEDWQTGESINTNALSSGPLSASDTVQVIWNNPDGDDSRIIGEGST